jgi:ABC-2 type transport system permease protein
MTAVAVSVSEGHRTRTTAVAASLARRSLNRIIRIPAAVIPTVAMPVFLLISFSGSFSAVTEVPGFPTDSILSWVAPYAVIQGAAFAGVGASQSVAADIENGFYDRLLMSPTSRMGLLLGPLSAAVLRVLLPFTVVLAVASLGNLDLTEGITGLLMLLLAAEGVAIVATLWGLGIVYKFRTQRSGGLVQVGIFVSMFLSVGQVPLGVMEGWLHGVASLNPMTNMLRMARQGFVGEITWGDTWPGLLVSAIGALLFGWWAFNGLRRMTSRAALGRPRLGWAAGCRARPDRGAAWHTEPADHDRVPLGQEQLVEHLCGSLRSHGRSSVLHERRARPPDDPPSVRRLC